MRSPFFFTPYSLLPTPYSNPYNGRMSSKPAPSATHLPAQLGLWDVAAITAGIIIGAGIYKSTPLIAKQVSSPGMLMLLWIVGGLIALNGALCYAELASAYPHAGGTYHYLNRAWGRWAGFLYVWCEFWVVRPGNIGAMAFIFAMYAAKIVPALDVGHRSLFAAAGAVLVLSAINLLGMRVGKGMQSLLTIVKLGGLVAIFVAGMCVPAATLETQAAAEVLPWMGPKDNLLLGLVLVLFAYGGWNETAAVAAEVRDPQRNMLRGLLLGTLLVVTTYLMVNYALLRGLGLAGMQAEDDAVASTLMSRAIGEWGARAISVSVCISCLGAINGMLFTGARLYYALGRQEKAFAWLGHWNQARGIPVRALLLQTLVALVLIGVFGWSGNGFEKLVMFTVPVFWSFLLLVAIAVITLRLQDSGTNRPFRLLLFPFEPLLFAAASALMIYSGITYMLSPMHERNFAYWFSAGGMVIPILVGIVVCVATRSRSRAVKIDD
jgi:APA family basic amino acid/polyamine antiporter